MDSSVILAALVIAIQNRAFTKYILSISECIDITFNWGPAFFSSLMF